MERLFRFRDQHPRQPPGVDRTLALRAAHAGRGRVRPHPAGLRAHALHQHALLRVARLSARQGDRPRRCDGVAVRHQRAAHVRGGVRDHAAHRPQDRRSGQGMGGRPHLGLHSELRAHRRRLHRTLYPQDHTARRPARHARGRVHRLHLPAAGAGDVHDPGHRGGVFRHHPRELVRRRALFQGDPGGSHRHRRRSC